MTRSPVCTSSWVPNSFLELDLHPAAGCCHTLLGPRFSPLGRQCVAICLLTADGGHPRAGPRQSGGVVSADPGRAPGGGGASAGSALGAGAGVLRARAEPAGKGAGLGPGGGRGRVRCSNRVRPGGGRKRSFPLAGCPGCPLPHPRALRVSALPETPAGSLPAHYPKVSGEGGEAEPRAAEEPGRCGTVCRPLGTGDGGAGGAGEEDRESRRAQGGKPPGIVALPQGR